MRKIGLIEAGPDHGPSGPLGLKATASPSYIYLHNIALYFSGKCKRLHTYVKRPFIPGQTFKLSTTASDSKNFKRPKIFSRPQIFCLEISGPKVALVLLCKFSLYRAVRAPIGARALGLQPHRPHGWSGPGSKSITNLLSINKLLKDYRV